MSGRLCGYCRDSGHIRPKCPMLHQQRKDFHEHIQSETLKVYRFLCKVGLGPNALVDANVLKWGAYNGKEPVLAQVLPYDYEITHRYYSGEAYKTTFARNLVPNLYRTKNVKYSKQVKINLLKLHNDTIYAEIPLLLLDGSNNVNTYGVNTYGLYQSQLAVPDNRYSHADGKELLEKLFISPSDDCPDIELPKDILYPRKEFYPERIQL